MIRYAITIRGGTALKYIKFEYAGFIIFQDAQNHKDIAEKFPNDNVLSAGNISVLCEENDVSIYGESLSLNAALSHKDRQRIFPKLCPIRDK